MHHAVYISSWIYVAYTLLAGEGSWFAYRRGGLRLSGMVLGAMLVVATAVIVSTEVVPTQIAWWARIVIADALVALIPLALVFGSHVVTSRLPKSWYPHVVLVLLAGLMAVIGPMSAIWITCLRGTGDCI